ncbi:hypothetical protein WJX81_004605 [Elliptochloris bilobata]|uniref:Trafficking protein particle complex subunit 6B n=1 Tax=Elliptochloris bilobata TaxID=381761 RepID=A0AAW1RE05_9CHLO
MPRQCSETCLELLALELVRAYGRQSRVPPAAAVDAIGFRTGRQLAERYTANRARLGEPLEVIKFVCKEFWMEVFRKQVDNLRTNHRGTFVLKDNTFRWLAKLSVDPAPPAGAAATRAVASVAELARDYLVLPCALVRGALAHLGVNAAVTAEAAVPPACEFTVTIKPR